VGAGQILASISNGPWTQKLSETGNNLAGISCPSSTTCYVVGNPVLGTTNGGSSWVSLPTGSSAFLGEISCPSTTTCFAAGTSILATTSSGATWINQANPNFPVLGISCASTTSCVAVGVHGEILTTSDGMHWTDRSIATMTNDLHDVNCPTTSNCFAVGNSSTILATTNGGTSWSFQTVQSGHDFSSVGCLPSTTRCEVGTFQGEIFVGSGTWTKEAAIDPIYAVQGVSCMGGLLAFHCAAVGTIGTIVSKDFVFRILGTGELTPKGGSSEVGDPTTFTFTWTVPSGKSWRDLESLDFRLSDDDGMWLWARFLVGNPSAFALLDANGNIIAEGVPGGAGVLDSPTATLDLAKSSFQGTGPTGPSVTVTFVVSFKPPAAGEHSARVYDTETSATDQTGRAQTPETVGHWVVRPADH
jgi:hypothetical protein